MFAEAEWVGINQRASYWLDIKVLEDSYALVQGLSGNELEPEQVKALTNATQHHLGGLLEGWYHDWCIFERERLQNMYLAMLNKLMAFMESCQEYETALLFGQRILQCDRAHERTHWRMMRLHYMAGDRTAALRQYERCVTALWEELGVEPARWTSALYEQIRSDQVLESMLTAPEPHLYMASANPLKIESRADLSRLQELLTEIQDHVKQYIAVVERPFEK